jgi:hypothetical protein
MLDNLGLRCIGPETLPGNVFPTPCPYNTTIDLDNAFLEKYNGRRTKNTIRLDKRCAACLATFRLRACFRKYGLIPDQPQKCCTFKLCTQPPWRGTKCCYTHFSVYASLQRGGHGDLRDLQKSFTTAMSRRWSFDGNYEKAMVRTTEIKEGKRPGSDLVILDDEYLPSGQLLELTIIEKISGNILIDTRVKHEDGLNHTSNKGDPLIELISHRQATKFFAKKNISVTANSLDADEIAEVLKNAGITEQTMFLVWHVTYKDLSLLRDFLESAGHYDILPPNKNCIRMIPLVRANLPAILGRNSFPANLEVLFPLFYPRHELIGRNHRALEDCLQTRLVIMACEELCKPLNERGHGWHPTMLVKISQKSLDDVAHKGEFP